MTEYGNPPPLVCVSDPDRQGRQVGVGARQRPWQQNRLGKRVVVCDRDPNLAGCGGTYVQPFGAPHGGEFTCPLLPIIDRLTCYDAKIDCVGVFGDPDRTLSGVSRANSSRAASRSSRPCRFGVVAPSQSPHTVRRRARWRASRPNSLACLQGLESLAPFSCSTVVGSVAVVGLRNGTAH